MKGMHILVIASLLMVYPSIAEAKSSKPTLSQVKKEMDDINLTLADLSAKTRAHYLYGMDDADKLSKLQDKMLEWAQYFPTNEIIVKPMFTVGWLLMEREQYDEASELLTLLQTNFPQNAYSLRSKAYLNRIKNETALATNNAKTASSGAK
jgi:hypothetical protein